MSDTIASQIRQRLPLDALAAYRNERPERMVNDFNPSDIAVLPAGSGFQAIALFSVKTNLLVFSNTTTHRMELAYDEAGIFLKMAALEDISEWGWHFDWCSPLAVANLPGADKLGRTGHLFDTESQCPKCKAPHPELQGIWDGQQPSGDKASAMYQVSHPAHGIWLALRVATWGVKLLATKVYLCKKCGHVWRVWLPK